MARPTRKYLVRLGPAVLPVEKGFEVLTDVTEHSVFGNSIKYVMGGDMGFFQILNNALDVVFTCPSNMILSVQAGTEEYVPAQATVTPIHGKPTNLHLVKPEETPDECA